MKREESIRILKLCGWMMLVNGISAGLMKIVPVYGMNTLVSALPYGFLLCEFLNEKPRKGMLGTVVLLSSLIVLPFSGRLFGTLLLAAFCAEVFYSFVQRKKSEQKSKVALITTFNTLLYPLLLLWELLATQGESTMMMTDFTVSLLIFVATHSLGFVGVRMSLKEKAEIM